ncbi:MAG: hypothetical protein FJW30_04730 [Acidobacteria bacterium]|nr:hypothetical protein [Acidobacteriota bacterium]
MVLFFGLLFQLAQNPSPMTETTRAHTRVALQAQPGRTHGRAVTFGRPKPNSPVIVHFHGAEWLPRQAARAVHKNVTAVAIQLGSGSSVYETAFASRSDFEALLAEAEAANRPVTLSAFSAGYGAIRAILRHSPERISTVILVDALHAGHESKSEDLQPFVAFARRPDRRLLITHSEIFPGTYASTSETADWLAAQLGVPRKAVLKWGPHGMQQIAEARRGKFRILSFAGNSAPDHVDHFHAIETWFRLAR